MPGLDYRICPHCRTRITHLYYEASYTETVYGTESGSVDFSLDNYEASDSESSDYGNYERGDISAYRCPECEEEIDPEKFKNSNENDLGNFPKTRRPRKVEREERAI